jgi:hypothetical protein
MHSKTTTTTMTTSDDDDNTAVMDVASRWRTPPRDATVLVPPPPSWSVRDLRLNATHDEIHDDDCAISDAELATLARRCLIDVRRLSYERRHRLRVHVGGIMRCASVLLESEATAPKEGGDGVIDDGAGDDESCDVHDGRVRGVDDDDNGLLTDEMVYDMPRGLTKMPIRGGVGWDDDVNDDWSSRDKDESRAVMNSDGVRSKMSMSSDDKMYFSIVTKRS